MSKVRVVEEVGVFGYILRRWQTGHGLEGVRLVKITLVHTAFRMLILSEFKES
jgi:hypothetical protein